MKKRVNDQISVGNDTKNKKPENKGSTQSGDNSKLSKRTSNIHRQ